jgi:phosphoenolpyruvate synthase/pyruvate phosphate dikinase
MPRKRAGVDPHESAAAAERLRTLAVPDAIATAVCEAYAALGGGPVVVRSSARAEDVPGASFAGQQDAYLNITGDEASSAPSPLLASLWNMRAVGTDLPGKSTSIA